MTNQIKKNPIIRTSLGLKDAIAEDLEYDYRSMLVERMKEEKNYLRFGDVEFRIAQEFGFCYGVEKAIDFAYQAIKKFPNKKIYITSEIIHNPNVNLRLIELGVEFLEGQYSKGKTIENLTGDAVVLIPAFGTTTMDVEQLKKIGCILVDTTCGSVVHVWKRVERYAKDGFTSIIHGKYQHEETIATSSHVTHLNGGKYLVVRDLEQTKRVCDYIERGGSKSEFLKEFEEAVSLGFDPDLDLCRIGVANQTTMLSSESLEIAKRIKQALVQKFGQPEIDAHFRSFDTICSATQERQDAVSELAHSDVDVILVIGGYNSSNTAHLLEISRERKKAFHIQDAADILSLDRIQHQPMGGRTQGVSSDWLPKGKVVVGLTAGASTPNRLIEDVMMRMVKLKGINTDLTQTINADQTQI